MPANASGLGRGADGPRNEALHFPRPCSPPSCRYRDPWRGWGPLLVLALAAPWLVFSCGPREAREEASGPAATDTLNAEQHKLEAIKAFYLQWDYAAARRHFQRALALDPGLARAHAEYAWFLLLEGQEAEAKARIRLARDLEPDNPVWQAWVGWLCFEAGDHACAETELRRALDRNPDLCPPNQALGLLYELRGETEKAGRYLLRAARDSAFLYNEPYAFAVLGHEEKARQRAASIEALGMPKHYIGLASVYLRLGDEGKALDLLQTALDSHHIYMPFVRINHVFEPLRDDPRFVDITKQVGRPGK